MEAKAEARKAHHILLFGCESVSPDKLTKHSWYCDFSYWGEGM